MAIYTKPLPVYEPRPFPPMEESLKIWIVEELRRLQAIITAQQEAIRELRAQNP